MGCGLEYFLHLKIEDLKKPPEWKELSDIIKSSDNWPGSRRFYFIGKKVGHSSNYSMKAPTFRTDILKESEGSIALSHEEATRFLATYHTLFPEIERDFQAGVRRNILENGRTLRTFQGFPRYFGKLINDKYWREAYSYIPAATVACITAEAVVNMQTYIEDNGLNWHLLNDKHDSMLIEAPEAEIQICAAKSREFMEQTLTNPQGETLKMGSGVSIGYNWQPYSSKNTNGLKEI
jgi:hypothetical protein